jgi:hypothetical protein
VPAPGCSAHAVVFAENRVRPVWHLESNRSRHRHRNRRRDGLAGSFAGANVNLDLDLKASFVVAANAEFSRASLLQEPEGVVERFRGLKSPPGQPTSIASHEAVWPNAPAHDALGQKVRQALVRQLPPANSSP